MPIIKTPRNSLSASAAIANVLMDVIEEGNIFGSLSIHDLPDSVIDRLGEQLLAAGWKVELAEGEVFDYSCVRAFNDYVTVILFRAKDDR